MPPRWARPELMNCAMATFQRPKLHFTPSLSGKRLLMTQTFRDFFRSEVISATEGIAVLDITLVFAIAAIDEANNDLGWPVGYGKIKRAAIDDLIEQMDERGLIEDHPAA